MGKKDEANIEAADMANNVNEIVQEEVSMAASTAEDGSVINSVADTTQNNKVNVQAAVDVTLLGINLMGMVSKITKEVEGEKKTITEFMVIPSKLDEQNKITIDAIVNEINKTIYMIENNITEEQAKNENITERVTAKNVKSALDVVGLGNAELTFMQTFIHYKKVENANGESAKSADDQGDKTSAPIIEYAFGIHVKSDRKPSSEEFKFLNINEVYVNVWNTMNEKVLERMQIMSTELLEQV